MKAGFGVILKSRGVASFSGLWETEGMAKQYVPKVNDPVFMSGKGFVRYVVTKVDAKKKTAGVKTISGLPVQYPDVAWINLHELAESHNAARIVKEATEGR